MSVGSIRAYMDVLRILISAFLVTCRNKKLGKNNSHSEEPDESLVCPYSAVLSVCVLVYEQSNSVSCDE